MSGWAGRRGGTRRGSAGEATPWTASPCGCAGQAAIELLGVLPLVLAIGLGVFQLLAAGVARELAGNAASAGAAALLQGTDPEGAARGALPGWSRSRVRVVVRGDAVRVVVRPVAVVPGVANVLTASVVAHAGRGAAAGAAADGADTTTEWPARSERAVPGATTSVGPGAGVSRRGGRGAPGEVPGAAGSTRSRRGAP